MLKRIMIGIMLAALPGWTQVKVSEVKPVYPPEAKQAGISGTVRLNALVGKDGTVQDITEVSGHPLLVASAVAAVKQWTYQPTRRDGEPVEVLTSIELNYALADAPAKQAAVAEVSGSRQEKKLVSRVKPIYPPDAKAAGIAGLVRMEVVIGSDGRVKEIRNATGHPVLVPAATDAIKQWVYEPTVVDGAPVDVMTLVDVNFTLAK